MEDSKILELVDYKVMMLRSELNPHTYTTQNPLVKYVRDLEAENKLIRNELSDIRVLLSQMEYQMQRIQPLIEREAQLNIVRNLINE